MGDNRLNSMDSRNGLGLIAENRIVGTSKFVFFRFMICVRQNKNAAVARFGQQAFLFGKRGGDGDEHYRGQH